MMDISLLVLFIPTFLFVSATPGMCMTLALTLGLSIGLRRTLWMMAGEVVAVGLVAVAGVLGMAAVMLKFPKAFAVFKIAGGIYLGYLGIQMWLLKGKMVISLESAGRQAFVSNKALVVQGFVTAITNPKGWAFFIVMLPPFISPDYALLPQLSVLIAVIMLLEFICLMLYASGGQTLRHILRKNGNVSVMNRISGSLMIAVGVWLALG